MNLPHNAEAEAVLLGAMLISGEAVRTAVAVLTTTDFYVPAHQRVFAAFDALHAKGHPVEILGAVKELERSGEIQHFDDPRRFLFDLQSGCGAPKAAPRYAAIVAHQSSLRALALAGTSITEIATADHDDAADALDQAHALLGDIRVPVTSIPEGLSSMDDFLDRPASSQSPWVVPGLLRADWRAVIVAPEGVGKSHLFRAFAMLSAQGIHPLSGQSIDRVRTLLVDLENPEEAIRLGGTPLRAIAQRQASAYEKHQTWIWHQPGGINLRTRRHRAELEAVLHNVKPDLVCLGPVYKAFRRKPSEDHEQSVEEVQQVFDDLRTRHRFGLLLEHHAPKKQNGFRDIEPFGSQRWLAWPEIGLGLLPEDDTFQHVTLKRWRGDRLPNGWPDALNRGRPGELPWVGQWNDGMPHYEKRGAA